MVRVLLVYCCSHDVFCNVLRQQSCDAVYHAPPQTIFFYFPKRHTLRIWLYISKLVLPPRQHESATPDNKMPIAPPYEVSLTPVVHATLSDCSVSHFLSCWGHSSSGGGGILRHACTSTISTVLLCRQRSRRRCTQQCVMYFVVRCNGGRCDHHARGSRKPSHHSNRSRLFSLRREYRCDVDINLGDQQSVETKQDHGQHNQVQNTRTEESKELGQGTNGI